VLKLRRGTVMSATPADGHTQQLEVEIAGEPRPAQADVAMVGTSEAGDDVVVNTQARDLALGSGGFDVVHANLTRGLSGEGEPGAHVMKLNYTSLQHAVHPIEGEELALPLRRPAAAFSLHGQLAPVAWAIGQRTPGARVGFVQTAGGALPGGLSRVTRDLRERGLLVAHITAAPAFGGEREAITTAGALHHGLRDLGWDAALCGPGPGILGSATALGHGGMIALDSLHTAAALGCFPLLVARMSEGDPRPRHQGLSHHSRTVLELALAPLVVAAPPGAVPSFDAGSRIARHDWRVGRADLDGYVASGLPARTMGRTLEEDPIFFAAALAAGSVLGHLIEGPAEVRRR
jgi:uncharacterized protein DUF3866